MTLKKAIKHCYEKVKKRELEGKHGCADDHLQLAKWLEKLQDYRNKDVSNMCKPLIEFFYPIGVVSAFLVFGFLGAFILIIIYKGGLKCLELFF